jgi:hypothetical protein
MNENIARLLQALDNPTAIDLDSLRQDLAALQDQATALQTHLQLYEAEFRRELRAKIELAGKIPECPTPGHVSTLFGEALLSARRAASQRFNEVYALAPLRRKT